MIFHRHAEHGRPDVRTRRSTSGLIAVHRERPDLHYLARATHVHASGGLLFHTPDECVVDLAGVDELLACTVALHEHREWPEIAALPLDSAASSGRVVVAMRDEAVAHGSDHVATRWRRAAS